MSSHSPDLPATVLLHLCVQDQYSPAIEAILDRHRLQHWVRYDAIAGRDSDGKHQGSQVFPGSLSVVQATLAGADAPALLADLQGFRQAKAAHAHLHAILLPVLAALDPE